MRRITWMMVVCVCVCCWYNTLTHFTCLWFTMYAHLEYRLCSCERTIMTENVWKKNERKNERTNNEIIINLTLLLLLLLIFLFIYFSRVSFVSVFDSLCKFNDYDFMSSQCIAHNFFLSTSAAAVASTHSVHMLWLIGMLFYLSCLSIVRTAQTDDEVLVAARLRREYEIFGW